MPRVFVRTSFVGALIVGALSVGALGGASEAHAGEFPSRVEFDVVDARGGDVLLRGQESIRVDVVSVRKDTVYRDTAGKVIQTESCRFRAGDLALETYEFENIVSGERVSVDVAGGQIRGQYRPTHGSPTQPIRGAWTVGDVFSKTLGHFAVRQLARLRAGEPVSFALHIPSRGESFQFRMGVVGDSKGRVEIAMDPVSWLLKPFVGTMSFIVSTGEKPVVEAFRGPSPVDSEPYRGKRVEVRFRYPGQIDGPGPGARGPA